MHAWYLVGTIILSKVTINKRYLYSLFLTFIIPKYMRILLSNENKRSNNFLSKTILSYRIYIKTSYTCIYVYTYDIFYMKIFFFYNIIDNYLIKLYLDYKI